MGWNFPVILGTRTFWKIRAFDYNQYIVLILYTSARFQSIESTSDFETKFYQNHQMNGKTLEKVNIKIVISI